MPALRECITGEEWRRRLAGLQAEASLAKLEADSRPEFSLRVLRVLPKGQADSLGIELGDLIVTFDGKPVLGVPEFGLMRTDQGGALGLWSPRRGAYEVRQTAARLGVSYDESWIPALAYVRSAERDAKWDALVSAAAAGWVRDEEAAETALYHAHRAGYRGWLTPAIMTMMSLHHGRPAECMTWAWLAKETTPLSQRVQLLRSFVHTAMFVGQFEWAQKVIDANPGCNFNFGRVPRPPARGGETPCTLAATRPPGAALEGLEANSMEAVRTLTHDAPWSFDFNSQERALIFGPALRNVHFTIDLDWRASRAQNSSTPPQMRLHLVDISEGCEEKLVTVTLFPGQTSRFDIPKMLNIGLKGASLCREGRRRLEVAARGPWCELRLDGRTLFLGAARDYADRKLACQVDFSNVAGAITRVKVRDLGESPQAEEPSTPPPSSPASVRPRTVGASTAWYRKNLVEAYLRDGKRGKDWDDDAVEALDLAGLLLANPDDPSYRWMCLTASRRALERGCADPLVTFAYARAVEGADGAFRLDLDRMYYRAAKGLLASTHAPALRAFAAARSSARLAGSCLPGRKEEAKRMAARALDALRLAMADKAVPSCLIVDSLLDLMKTGSGSEAEANALAAEAEKLRPAASRHFKGSYFTDSAWKARGGDWAKNVRPEAMQQFEERMALGVASLEEAWKIDSKDPAILAQIIAAAAGHEKTRTSIALWLDRALKADPNNLGAARAWLQLNMPRWFGSIENLQSVGKGFFALACIDDLHPAMAHLLIDAHDMATRSRTFHEDEYLDGHIAAEYWRRPETWTDVKKVYDRILKQEPDSVYWRSRYAYYACKCARWAEAKEQFDLLGDRVAPEVFNGEVALHSQRMTAMSVTGH